MTESHGTLVEQAIAQVGALFSIHRRAFCAQPIIRDVSIPQLHTLMALQEEGSMTVSELGRLLSISIPSASSIVDRMEEHGLVGRTRDEADRRVVHVHISELGREAAESLVGMRRDQMRRLLGAMTDEELSDVIRAAEAIRNTVSRIRASEEPRVEATVS